MNTSMIYIFQHASPILSGFYFVINDFIDFYFSIVSGWSSVDKTNDPVDSTGSVRADGRDIREALL